MAVPIGALLRLPAEPLAQRHGRLTAMPKLQPAHGTVREIFELHEGGYVDVFAAQSTAAHVLSRCHQGRGPANRRSLYDAWRLAELVE